MNNLTAKHVMDPSPLTLRPGDGVIVALRQLLAAGLSGAPVVDEDSSLVGFLSEADCMRGALMGGYFSTIGELVRDRMTTEVECVAPESNIVDVAETFLRNNRRVLPVASQGQIVGLIARSAVLACLVERMDSHRSQAA